MRILILLMACIAVTACERPAAEISATANPTTIVTYKVPTGMEREVAHVINELLSADLPGGVGRASVLPNGLVAVAAVESAHVGVRTVIGQLPQVPVIEESRIQLHYWLVTGLPAAESSYGPGLGSIEAALSDVAKAAGPMSFSRGDYVQHSVTSGSHASVSGGLISGAVDAAALGDRISVDLNLSAPSVRATVRSEMDFQSGETVVLAMMGDAGTDQPPGTMNLFVVRAESF